MHALRAYGDRWPARRASICANHLCSEGRQLSQRDTNVWSCTAPEFHWIALSSESRSSALGSIDQAVFSEHYFSSPFLPTRRGRITIEARTGSASLFGGRDRSLRRPVTAAVDQAALLRRRSWVSAVTPSSRPISSRILPFSRRRTVVPVKCICRPVAGGREPMRKSLKAGPV
jgi:hypothetical protein